MMEKQFIDINELMKFLETKGFESYESLIASNKIVSNGMIGRIKIPMEISK